MKRITVFVGGFLLIYIMSVVAINLPGESTETTKVVDVQPEVASPSAQVEVPEIQPNLQ